MASDTKSGSRKYCPSALRFSGLYWALHVLQSDKTSEKRSKSLSEKWTLLFLRAVLRIGSSGSSEVFG